jgi:pimeloyl-ACP methyl ester carboxylesterase
MGLAFSRAGSGPPLVLIHGLGHRRQGWDAVLGQLTPHRDVITVDLPGHGDSPPLAADGKEAVPAMVDALADLLCSLDLEQPHLAGNSLGGTLVLALAARGRAATVTTLSPAGFYNSRLQFQYARGFFNFALLSGRALRPLVPWLSASLAGRAMLMGAVVARPGRMNPEQVQADMAGILRSGAAVHAVLSTFLSFTLPVPDSVPVTIAWGSKDRILSPKNAEVARERIPHARFRSLAGCGHVPMTDDPELIASVLLEGSADS